MASKKENIRKLSSKYAAGNKLSRRESEEFGRARKEFIICPHMEAVYYKKSWHSSRDFSFFLKGLKKKKGIAFQLCPVHRMVKNKQCEGMVTIKSIPQKFKKDIFNLIKNMGERASRIDILDRVLEVKSKNNELIVTASENQLARKIARKIGEAFKKKAQVKIMSQKDGDFERIEVVFVG